MADLLHSALVQGFLKSWGMILVSEIGDKTFFIAAIMAMKNPRSTVYYTLDIYASILTYLNTSLVLAYATWPFCWLWQVLRYWSLTDAIMVYKRSAVLQVFIGALSALALMTALSAAMGWAAPNLVTCLPILYRTPPPPHLNAHLSHPATCLDMIQICSHIMPLAAHNVSIICWLTPRWPMAYESWLC